MPQVTVLFLGVNDDDMSSKAAEVVLKLNRDFSGLNHVALATRDTIYEITSCGLLFSHHSGIESIPRLKKSIVLELTDEEYKSFVNRLVIMLRLSPKISIDLEADLLPWFFGKDTGMTCCSIVPMLIERFVGDTDKLWGCSPITLYKYLHELESKV